MPWHRVSLHVDSIQGQERSYTLLKAGSFHRDFETLDLSIEELPSVFILKSTRLDARDQKMMLEKGSPFLVQAISQKVSMSQSFDLVDTDMSFSACMISVKVDSSISLPQARPLLICKTLARFKFPIRWSLAIWTICSRLIYLGDLRQQKIIYH